MTLREVLKECDKLRKRYECDKCPLRRRCVYDCEGWGEEITAICQINEEEIEELENLKNRRILCQERRKLRN